MSVVELLIKLCKFKSITPNDDGALDFISNFMSEFEAKRFDKNGVKNLFLKKKFGDGAHICFAGHIDVVPPGDGWQDDPFLPTIKDGFIYARGTQDMKSGVAAMLLACKNAKFDGTLSLLITSDEEGDGVFGTRYVLDEIVNSENIDFAIVGEPTCDEIFGDTIKVGRRGSINATLIINGKQGHAAYPKKCTNPVHQLATKFDKIAGYDLDQGNEFFEPSKIVITDIRGGMEVTNVTPGFVKIMMNCRNSNLTNLQDFKAHIDENFAKFDYELKIGAGSEPFLTDKNSKIVQKISNSVEKITKIKPNLNAAGGTSDARFFAKHKIPVVEFGTRNDTIHAVNERVSLDEVQKLYEIYLDLIENF